MIKKKNLGPYGKYNQRKISKAIINPVGKKYHNWSFREALFCLCWLLTKPN